jgi:hypothetical protein
MGYHRKGETAARSRPTREKARDTAYGPATRRGGAAGCSQREDPYDLAGDAIDEPHAAPGPCVPRGRSESRPQPLHHAWSTPGRPLLVQADRVKWISQEHGTHVPYTTCLQDGAHLWHEVCHAIMAAAAGSPGARPSGACLSFVCVNGHRRPGVGECASLCR